MDEVAKSLPFWTERMGFEKTVEVPDGSRLGFVILIREGVELMIQTRESTRKDTPQFTPLESAANTALSFIEVDNFADTLQRLNGYPITMPERTTFYGMREIGVFEPSGHAIIFAAPTATPH